ILLLSKLLTDNKSATMTDKQVDFAKTINASGTELLELINEILDLSKVEAGKMDVHPEGVSVREFMWRMEKMFAPMASQKNIELKLACTDNLPETMVTDRQRIEQIIKNLMSNALKFTQRGTVSLQIQRPAAGTAFMRQDMDPGSSLAFVVSDTGTGIPQDQQKVIFEAFQQADGSTSRRYGGTGLGLSISRELAKLLGGELHLESRVGAGSMFTLFLPEDFRMHERPAENKKPALEPTGENKKPPLDALMLIPDDRRTINFGDKTLLIIEDDPRFAKTLCELAQERAFKVLVAGNGETGLHFADYYKPSAIILDVGLPGIDGWTVLRRLKENPDTRHIPVHFISAADSTLDAMKMGAIGFFTKPVSMAMIDEAFEKIKGLISRQVKSLLIIEDDETQRMGIREMITSGDVHISEAASGGEALRLLRERPFDCIVLDLGLPDMAGIDLLARIKEDERLRTLPVIIYTGRELTTQERSIVNQYAEKIIIKGVHSADKLLDETALFLHRVEKDLPEEMRRIIRMTHDKEAAFIGKKILIVDDDMRNVYALSSVIEEKGMDVVIAKNGRECLAQLNDHKDVDLILMDIMMPEMDGYETTRAIRAKEGVKKLPIIALTAKAMRGDRDKCVAAGASDYLAKPVDIEKLLSMLRVWMYNNA
ncbi:MAG: response regulator, partial [Pseudomonadota bacterium]